MYISIDCENKYDPQLLDIAFTDEKKTHPFTLEIACSNIDKCNALKGSMIGARGIYQMDKPKFDLQISADTARNIVCVSGNLKLALRILNEINLISDSLMKAIESHEEIMKFINQSDLINQKEPKTQSNTAKQSIKTNDEEIEKSSSNTIISSTCMK